MQTELSLQNAHNKLYLDIQQYYSHHSGFSSEELLSNTALLKIISIVFSGKPVTNCLSRDEDLLAFNKENLKFLNDCIQKNDLTKETIHTIITNCIAVTNKEILIRPRKQQEKEISKFSKNHFDIPSVVNRIRDYYGFQCKQLKQMGIEFKIKEFFLIILSIFLLFASVIVFVLAGWWNQNPPVIRQNGTNWFSNNFINPLSDFLLHSGLPITDQNIGNFVPYIIVSGIIFMLLFFCSIWINKKIWDRNKLQYQIHFLCRMIGIEGEELKKTGWL